MSVAALSSTRHAQLRIGIVGLGTIGRVHLAALKAVGIHAIYAADRNEQHRSWAADTHGVTCYPDYRQLLAAESLDGLIVATPPRSHAEIVLGALDRDLHVLCEKPMAVDMADCESIVSAAAASTRVAAIAFCHRFEPAVQRLHDLVSTGALGEIVFFRAAFVHGMDEELRPWLRDRGISGGGVLADSGTHAIDLFRYLVGDVARVSALTARTQRSIEREQDVEDSAVLVLRSGGCLGSVQLCWRAAPWEGSVEIVGLAARAFVHYDDTRVSLHMRSDDSGWRDVPLPPGDRFKLQIEHWLACIGGEQAPLVTVHDGLEATRLLVQAYDDVAKDRH